MNNKLCLLILLFICIEYSFAYKSVTTLHIIGKNYMYYQLRNEDNEILIDSLKPINLLTKKINEPIRVVIINLATRNYVFFYLDIGKHDITVDVDKLIIASTSSELNRQENELLQIKKYYDSIPESDRIKTKFHNAFLQKCLKISNSFAALRFTNVISQEYLQVGITKDEVLKLFNNLDKSLYKYPTYKETKKYINEYIIKYNTPIDTVLQPIWNAN